MGRTDLLPIGITLYVLALISSFFIVHRTFDRSKFHALPYVRRGDSQDQQNEGNGLLA